MRLGYRLTIREKILIIDVDTNNFSEKAEDLGTIINNIDAELHGLFKTK
jgi:deoxyadenosine/deoxycytidine kinase